MLHFGNLEFYGKDVRELNQNEIELLMNDLLLISTIELMKRGEVFSEVIDGKMVTVGTEESYIERVDERHKILRKLLNMEKEPDILLFLVSEGSNYSFKKFTKDMFEYMVKGGEVDEMKKVLGMDIHLN
jgi:hypothetical protein